MLTISHFLTRCGLVLTALLLPFSAVADVVFGPEDFVRGRGGPTVEIVDFSIATGGSDFTLRVLNGGTDGDGRRVSSAKIELNGELVVDARDFAGAEGKGKSKGGPPAIIERLVTLSELNTLAVELRGRKGSFLTIEIEGDVPDSMSEIISPAGGQVELPGLGSVDFPEQAFDEATTVTVSATSSPEVAEAFDPSSPLDTASIFRPSSLLGYELRINTGDLPPVSDTVRVTIELPSDFLSTIPSGHQPEVFAQIYQDGGEEILDSFELFASVETADGRALIVELPTAAFTNTRTADGSYEAIVVLASTPGSNRSVLSFSRQLTLAMSPSLAYQQAADECQAASISCPISTGCGNVTSPYNPARKHPVTGATRPHYGTDFGIPIGTPLVSPADGVVERSYSSTSYGETIIIRHSDGSASLLAHLSSRSVAKGAPVSRGDPIGLSGNTGLSSGPHLHMEYVPNGQIIQSKNRIDPVPCIGSTTEGSITVSDNGSLADDAFEVFFDGVRIGATSIGGANTLSVSNLIPGDHSLRIVAIIAPDDVGTYQIVLADGLTFAGGGTSQSGVIGQGESATFTVNVPNQSSIQEQ